MLHTCEGKNYVPAHGVSRVRDLKDSPTPTIHDLLATLNEPADITNCPFLNAQKDAASVAAGIDF